MLSAQELYARGVQHARTSRYRAATTDLARAADRTSDPDLLALIAGLRAVMDSEHSDTAVAVRTLNDLLARSERLSQRTVAVLQSQLGLVWMRAGDGSAALPHLDAAIAGLRDEPDRLINALFMRGGVFYERSDSVRAAADYQHAARIAREYGDEHLAAQAQHNEGAAALLHGDVVQALHLMGSVQESMDSQSPVMGAVAGRDRAEALLAAGLPAEASELLRRCAETFGRHHLRQSQADAELLLARTLADSAPEQAVLLARKAASRFRRRGSLTWAMRAQALSLTVALLSRPWDPTTVRAATRALPDLAGEDLDASREPLALALELHHVRAGKPWRRTPAVRDDAPIVTRLAEAEVRVEVSARTGQDAEALDRARDGIRLLRNWQSSTDSLELRSSLAMHGYRMVEQAAAVAMRSGDPALHFEWSERSRGFVAASTPLTRPPAPDSAEDAELEALRGLLAIGEDLDAPQVAQVRDRIRRRQWARERASRISVDIAGLEETVDVLGERDATLVSFLSDPSDVSVLVASRDGCRVIPVTSRAAIRADLAGLQADLDMSSADLRPTLAAVVRDGLRRRLDHLSAMIWQPIESSVRTRRVVISAPAALAAVPWSLMRPLRDRSITVPLSVTQWLRHTAVEAPIRSVGFITGPGVPRAGTEVTHAAKQWPGATIVDAANATTASMRELTRNTDLLHVAAHGRHTPGNPMFSGLELLDGPWFGHDVAELTMVPSVVVLSACELGRSTARWGEETIGMARAWLHSGVRCVIAAPCTVNDAATSDYLAAVHSGMAGGLSPSDALLAAVPDERAPFLAFGAGF
ncbi:CHAT domain-containing protein [Branchiibius cervicis]|uniref:CHAT domain-containing protein n=1 Tax=Branchiibius cervicis TaxID=908252 RepID=A0ABW2AUC7_9MICO